MGCGVRIGYSGLGIHESTRKNQHQNKDWDDGKQPDGFAHEQEPPGEHCKWRNSRDSLFAPRFSLFAVRVVTLSERSESKSLPRAKPRDPYSTARSLRDGFGRAASLAATHRWMFKTSSP